MDESKSWIIYDNYLFTNLNFNNPDGIINLMCGEAFFSKTNLDREIADAII